MYFFNNTADLPLNRWSVLTLTNRLISRARSDRLAQAITALGRIIKTIYILRFFSDKPLRYEVHGQRNLEESRHALAKHTFFADQGVFKTSDYEEIMNRASCLSLISNAVLLWNTIFAPEPFSLDYKIVHFWLSTLTAHNLQLRVP